MPVLRAVCLVCFAYSELNSELNSELTSAVGRAQALCCLKYVITEWTDEAAANDDVPSDPKDGAVRLFLPRAMEDRPIEKRGYAICSRRCSLAAAISAVKFDTCDAPNGPALRTCNPEELKCYDEAIMNAAAINGRSNWVNATLGGAGLVLGGALMVGVFFGLRGSRRGRARGSHAPAVLGVQTASRCINRSEGLMSK